MNYYEKLGVSPRANDREIRSAYRKQMKRFHPDRNRGQEQYATEKTREIIEAYEAIKTAELRAEYDAKLMVDAYESGFVRREAAQRRRTQTAEPEPVRRISLVVPGIIIGLFVLLLVLGAAVSARNAEPTTKIIGSWAFDESKCYKSGTTNEVDTVYSNCDPGATVNVDENGTFELYANGLQARGTWEIDEKAAEDGYDIIRLDYYDEYENSPLRGYFGEALYLKLDDDKAMYCGFALDDETDCYLWFYRTA